MQNHCVKFGNQQPGEYQRGGILHEHLKPETSPARGGCCDLIDATRCRGSFFRKGTSCTMPASETCPACLRAPLHFLFQRLPSGMQHRAGGRRRGSLGSQVYTCTALVGSLMVAGRVMRERSLPIAFLSTLHMEKPRCKGLGAGNRVLEFAARQLSLLML